MKLNFNRCKCCEVNQEKFIGLPTLKKNDLPQLAMSLLFFRVNMFDLLPMLLGKYTIYARKIIFMTYYKRSYKIRLLSCEYRKYIDYAVVRL